MNPIRNHVWSLIPPALLLVSLSGCALQSDVRILEDRLISLERKNADLQETLSRNRQEKQSLEQRLQQYGNLIEEKDMSLRDQSAGLQVTADQIRSEIQAINGRLEETAFRLNQRIDALERNIESRPPAPSADFSSSGGAGERNDRRVDSGRIDDSAGPPPSGAPDVLYATGKQAFDQQDYDRAERHFRQLLDRHPRATLAGNAQFWLGEIFYRRRNFEEAILAYQQVIETYPDGNKVAAALLKQGFAFSGLGDKENARLILRELLDRFSHTREARIAEQKLDNL
ncbi:MAG: tol-pal system protein YbgF [Desulfococcaceae bacterium]